MITGLGCAGPTLLTTEQVWAVAGLRPHQSRTLTTDHGSVVLSSEVPLRVWTTAGPLPATPISGLSRVGDELVVQVDSGAPVHVDHGALEGAQVVTFPVARKVALTAAAVVGSALIYLTIAAIVIAARPSN